MKSRLDGDLSPKIAAHLKNNGLVDLSAHKAGMGEEWGTLLKDLKLSLERALKKL
jgi:hypothetical protein